MKKNYMCIRDYVKTAYNTLEYVTEIIRRVKKLQAAYGEDEISVAFNACEHIVVMLQDIRNEIHCDNAHFIPPVDPNCMSA